ncbi:Nn.00g080490.m01.CDS01 [Neocucurbitaria sp. VM-36]
MSSTSTTNPSIDPLEVRLGELKRLIQVHKRAIEKYMMPLVTDAFIIARDELKEIVEAPVLPPISELEWSAFKMSAAPYTITFHERFQEQTKDLEGYQKRYLDKHPSFNEIDGLAYVFKQQELLTNQCRGYALELLHHLRNVSGTKADEMVAKSFILQQYLHGEFNSGRGFLAFVDAWKLDDEKESNDCGQDVKE